MMIDFSDIDPKDCFMVNHTNGTETEGWIDILPYDSWVITENGCVITCPNCGERLELYYPDGTEVRYLPHCPWCGKRLEK